MLHKLWHILFSLQTDNGNGKRTPPLKATKSTIQISQTVECRVMWLHQSCIIGWMNLWCHIKCKIPPSMQASPFTGYCFKFS